MVLILLASVTLVSLKGEQLLLVTLLLVSMCACYDYIMSHLLCSHIG